MHARKKQAVMVISPHFIFGGQDALWLPVVELFAPLFGLTQKINYVPKLFVSLPDGVCVSGLKRILGSVARKVIYVF
jgi:hypothetical protein